MTNLLPPIAATAAATLLIAATPGRACEKSAGLPGAPCTCLTVSQDADLNFSVRPDLSSSSVAPQSLSQQSRASIAIGSAVKADLAIFARGADEGKELDHALIP